MKIFLTRCEILFACFLDEVSFFTMFAQYILELVVQLRNEEDRCEEAEARVRELEKQVPTLVLNSKVLVFCSFVVSCFTHSPYVKM